MGVKFSQLPEAMVIASNDKIAVLDVSDNILKKTSIAHSADGTEFGPGTTSKYGHVKLIDALDSTGYADGEALSAFQGKVLSNQISTVTTDVTNLKAGQVNLAVNPTSTVNMNIWIENN